ncbi:hypothetical protein [Rubinisphaera sp.]|uniref:hypothetical protein n=1 Tax=Rubinisphaera sp. TaxID=2024857 RepID=UPI000C0C9CB4|nr:hypothetical protein [Rubinisphaera sp.]MBV10404.1 hypothetical protein [Rubinisphaera sp.]HCS52971.1 hypothetical protein [Planctomycetaceae bacterium]|tara:strand:- start:2400 stop:2870 length:471 start_codon:yes stop_codon:yes gene_type:complete
MDTAITPQFIGSIALMRHPEEGEKRWMTLWNSKRNQFEMVTALRLENDTYRECLDRELAWKLELQRGKEYLISSMARLHIEQELTLPGDEIPAFYAIEFYVVDPYGKPSFAKLDKREDLHWLTTHEILAGFGPEDRAVDPRLVYLINKFELISPYS